MKQLTPAAEAAKLIRKELKEHFPDTKFTVISQNFADGDSVDIIWTDGVMKKRVEQIVSKYEKGSFNTTTDLYEYDNRNDNIPQAKFVHPCRNMSDKVHEDIKNYLEENEIYTGRERLDARIYRIFTETNYS